MEHLVDHHNRFHKLATSISFMQLYRKIPQIEKGWNKYAEEKDIYSQRKRPVADDDEAECDDVQNVKHLATEVNNMDVDADEGIEVENDDATKGYEWHYKQFIDQFHKDTFKSYRQFRRARSFWKKLQKSKFEDHYTNYMAQHCDYGDALLNTSDVFFVNEKVGQKFFGPKTLAAYGVLGVEILKFCVPTKNDDVPWLLRQAKDVKKLNAFFVPLQESKVYQDVAQDAGWIESLVTTATAKGDADGPSGDGGGDGKGSGHGFAKGQKRGRTVQPAEATPKRRGGRKPGSTKKKAAVEDMSLVGQKGSGKVHWRLCKANDCKVAYFRKSRPTLVFSEPSRLRSYLRLSQDLSGRWILFEFTGCKARNKVDRMLRATGLQGHSVSGAKFGGRHPESDFVRDTGHRVYQSRGPPRWRRSF